MFLEQEDGETKENKYIESINKQKEGKCTNHPTDVKKKHWSVKGQWSFMTNRAKIQLD